jgi:hypothetical protein
MSKITSVSHQANCWWFNPGNGSTTLIGTYANAGVHQFKPPHSNDGVLVIDAAEAKLVAPGTADL